MCVRVRMFVLIFSHRIRNAELLWEAALLALPPRPEPSPRVTAQFCFPLVFQGYFRATCSDWKAGFASDGNWPCRALNKQAVHLGRALAARGAPGGGARVPPRGCGGGRCPGCHGGLRPPRCPSSRMPPPSSRPPPLSIILAAPAVHHPGRPRCPSSSRPPRCPRPQREPRRRTPGYPTVGGYHGVPEAFSSFTVAVFASHAWSGKVAALTLFT